MRVLRRLLWVGLAALFLYAGWSFAALNGAAVSVDLLAVQFPAAPLWLGLLIAFGVGAGAAGLAALYEIAKLGLLARRYRKAVVRLESEIHQLRNLPLAVEEGESLAAAPASGRSG